MEIGAVLFKNFSALPSLTHQRVTADREQIERSWSMLSVFLRESSVNP